MKQVALIFMALACVLLTGCASIVEGNHQTVSVKTPPVHGANCVLWNSKGKWYVSNTPGSVVVHQDYGSLHVKCRKPHYATARRTVRSHMRGMMLGNAVFGGVIGAGVDAADGAAYLYPQNIIVPMRKGHDVVKKTHQKKKHS